MEVDFTTIGTVTQKPDNMIMEETWDAELQKYKVRERSNYTSILNADIINSLDIAYIDKLEQRPFYGAISPGLISEGSKDEGFSTASLIEFSPSKDCIPNSPVEVKVENVYWGDGEPSMVGETVLFCDHNRKETEPLEAGKRYIAFTMVNFSDSRMGEGYFQEYVPETIFKDGSMSSLWSEMGEDFWNTDEGVVWQNFIDELAKLSFEAVPVTPTRDTELLSPFHDGRASIVEGENISRDEYKNGSNVCLVPQSFAQLNNLEVGDDIKLQLYFTDYKYSTVAVTSSGGMFRTDILTPEGKKNDVFFESDYTIKGIYFSSFTGMDLYELVTNEIIIPSASVPEENVRNIIAEGPMQGYNASFQIENGGINDFYKEFYKLPESALLEVTFDDKGYERFASQMNNLQMIAIIIFLVGFVSVIASSAFLLYSAIIRQRRRTAIERAFGMTRRECRTSLLMGIMVLAVIASIAGGIVGGIANKKMLSAVSLEEDYFSPMYSKGIAANEDEKIFVAVSQDIVRKSIVLAVGVEVAGIFAMSLFLIERNLKINPIYLLGVREDE